VFQRVYNRGDVVVVACKVCGNLYNHIYGKEEMRCPRCYEAWKLQQKLKNSRQLIFFT